MPWILEHYMNLHEYQGKEMLSGFGVAIQRGIVAKTAAEAVASRRAVERDSGTLPAIHERRLRTQSGRPFVSP